MTLENVAALHTLFAEASRLLPLVGHDQTEARVSPEGWTRKQVLGHLIDSCLNNHYRIALAVIDRGYRGPTYKQEGWVAVHRYDLLSWQELVAAWEAHNRLLLHVLDQLSERDLELECAAGDEQCNLRCRLQDYTDHMQHHLAQIYG